MLSRIFSLHSRTHLRLLSCTLSPSLTSTSSSPRCSQIPEPYFLPRHHFSTNNNNNNNNGQKPTSSFWEMGQETDNLDDIFGIAPGEKLGGVSKVDERESKVGAVDPTNNGQKPTREMPHDADNLDGIWGIDDEKTGEERESKVGGSASERKPWALHSDGGEADGGLFGKSGGDGLFNAADGGGREAATRGSSEFQPWNLGEDVKEEVEDVFGIGREIGVGSDNVGDERNKEERELVSAAEKLVLEKEEQALLDTIKGPDRTFGDLVAASGITDAMLDSLIALKNFLDIQGLPPLEQIEDERYEKTIRKSARYEIELQKQEEAAKARVRKVDEKGRAYGTGKRKCSIARVWIQPGEGKFLINEKEFDVYFPVLDHRAALLRPFSETRTLGLWDVKCTVKGGGVSGQVDAVQLGISRALQNWEPGLRPPLRAGGFLTRDPRVVERKKPGKAKARKSFQWVKR